MKPGLIKHISLTLAVVACGFVTSIAAPYEKGESIAAFTAKDQFENAYTFKPAETRFLLVSHDMETGKKANAALDALGKDYLPSRKAVYLANIFGMPAIGRMFAMPKMKKYSHRIVLADDAALIARFPEQKDRITVLSLSNGKVGSVSYWTPGAEPVAGFLK